VAAITPANKTLAAFLQLRYYLAGFDLTAIGLSINSGKSWSSHHGLADGQQGRAATTEVREHEGEPRMLTNLKKLFKDEEGATAVEYGLIVAAIAGLIITVVYLLGSKVNNAFQNVAEHMP